MKKFSRLLFLLFILNSSCKTFYDSKGEKFKLWGLARDNSKHFKDQKIYPFNKNNLSKIINNDSNSFYVEALDGQSVDEIKKYTNKCIILFWYPKCPASIPIIKLANSLDSMGVTVLLASLYYDFPYIRNSLNGSRFENKVIYIIPTNQYGDRMILKKRAFIKDVCPDCYDQYKDELVHSNGLLLNNNNIEVLYQLNFNEIANSLK